MMKKFLYSHQRRLAIAVGLLLTVSALVLGWLTLQYNADNPTSTDAEIGANIINVSAPVPGRIISLNVKENGYVHRGDVMFVIDPYLYRLRVDQARAELKIAEAANNTQQRSVLAERSNAEVTNGQITRAKVNLKLATQTLSRLQPMLSKGYVTAQQVDDAATARRDAEISLQQALKQSAAADALVSSTDASEALVAARKAALSIAERELENTVIRAPSNGLVVGLNISPGEFVAPDQAIFTLINSEHWYASAFFRETELVKIEIGQCATVYVMTDSKTPIKGKVEGIGWGISSQDQLTFPRSLPYVPKSLNWVRVAQRFPVRISLENPPVSLMRVGATAEVIVHHDGC
ncbi:multidrug transporter subunit MdtN [Kosakonia oryziphila]|uniref:Membrane fusion protein, multidrug efflux system n=1 Tax=Kosakonia oryziphila TaxID=1005667 RepID=A0A1C4AQW9_9ENTR|nr:membrane fusion protein, multidrug efflux system [Kosakonia oryziphila]